MSRVGKKPIPIPKGVTVQIAPDAVEVKGPKGTLRQPLPPGIVVEMVDGALRARPERDERSLSKFHGLARSLVANAVTGVSDGFQRDLDIVGIGYRAEAKGQSLTLALGYSHQVLFDVPKGVEVAVQNQTHLVVTGIDRQAVGQVAANLRALRKPDPYKQKGIRYTGEVLKKKVGKTGA
jgi:large subunit ribosomal protein L6